MIRFNGVNPPDFLVIQSVDIQALPDIDVNLRKIAGSDGYLAGKTELGAKKIACAVKVVLGDRSLQDCGRDLARWLRGDNFKLSPLIIEDDLSVQYQAKISTAVELKDLLVAGEGSLEFIVPSGDSEAVNETVVSGRESVAVYNRGDKKVFPVIRAVLGAGINRTDVVFSNVTTGEKIMLKEVTLLANTVIIVDCIRNRVTFDGRLDMSNVALETIFFGLISGTNTVECSVVETMSVTFRERYI